MISRAIMAFALLMLLVGGMQHVEAGVIDISGGDVSVATWGQAPGGQSYGQTLTVPAW